MPLFVLFWVDFHSARLFFAYYGVFCAILGNFWVGVKWEMSMGPFSVFALSAFFCIFDIFWLFLGTFWVSVEIWAF